MSRFGPRWRPIRVSFAVAGLVATLHQSTSAQEAGLGLERAVELAVTRNERAGTAAAQQEAAAARLDRARTFFFPDLFVSGTFTRRSFETTRTVDGERFKIQARDAFQSTATMTLPIFDARSIPLYRQASREANAARLIAADDVRLLGFEAADAFLATIGSEQILAAAEHRVEYSNSALQEAKVRFDAGLAGANDVSRAELEVATADRALAVANATARAAMLELGNLLDTEIAPPLTAPEGLLEAASAPLASDSSLVADAIARRPDLAARVEHAKGEHQAALEPLLRAVPNFTFDAQARVTNEQGLSNRASDWSLGVTMGWPLYDGGERYAERDERSALARAADLDVRASIREIALDVYRARVALERSQAALKATTEAVDAARRNATETSELYRQGLARALEVADASVRLFEAEVALAGERFALGRAFLDLRSALGLEPPGRQP